MKKYLFNKMPYVDMYFNLIEVLFEAFKIETINPYDDKHMEVRGQGECVHPTKKMMNGFGPEVGDYYCVYRVGGKVRADDQWAYDESWFENHIKSGYIKEIT